MLKKTIDKRCKTVLLYLFCCLSFIYARDKSVPLIDLTQANDTITVSKIRLQGNHKTKSRVIFNELLFKEGSRIDKTEFYDVVIQSRQNLENTSLFNFVYINYWLVSKDEIAFEIKVDERWYLWALPIFEQADRNLSSFLESGDWSRVNYGFYIKRENFRGMNETLKFRLRMGFLNELMLFYKSPDHNNKLSWGSSIAYQSNNQVSYNIFNNEPVQFKLDNSFVQQKWFGRLFLFYRHHHLHRHQFTLGYNGFHIKDTLAHMNPEYLQDGKTSMRFINLAYMYSFDQRDNKVYPLSGHFITGSLMQDGLNLLTSRFANFSAFVNFQQYGKLWPRFYYGINSAMKYNNKEQTPFVLNTELGYNEFLNGYEYNLIDGSSFAFQKQKIAFELIPTKTANINFISLNQFSKIHYALYVKAFSDIGYAYKSNPHFSNNLSNTFLYGYGVGVDFVTYYDKVLSINYSVNKFGTTGVYFHLDIAL